MPIIYFFGPDGSGKTTLCSDLAGELAVKGLRVKRSWMRGSHTLMSFLSRFLSGFSVFKGQFNPYYGVNVTGAIARIWSILEYLAALPIILTRFILPNLLGYTVVADRYVTDLVVWIALVTRDDRFLRSILAKHLLFLGSRGGPAFLVTAEDDALVRRGGGKLNVLRRQKRLYKAVRGGAYLIDTTGKRPCESLGEVLQVLENHERRRCRWAFRK